METVVVKSNEFETLLEKIKKEREISLNSDLNQRRRIEILRTIEAVYFFLRSGLRMPYREISLEEFEIAEARLRLIAIEELKKPWNRFWNKLGIRTWWDFFVKFGYFRNQGKHTIIGRWDRDLINDDGEIGYACNHSYVIAPNIESLQKEIFSKKYHF